MPRTARKITIKLPQAVRLFRPSSPQSKLLVRTDEVLSPGEAVTFGDLEVVSYDHRDKLGLKLDRPGEALYILVEELSDEIHDCAFRWTREHERPLTFSDLRTRRKSEQSLADLKEEARTLIERYAKPKLQVVK